MLNIGDLVREYRVAGFIGRGETGAVYRVLDAQGRAAAMNALDWNVDDVAAVARMRKEAAAAQALRHPDIP